MIPKGTSYTVEENFLRYDDSDRSSRPVTLDVSNIFLALLSHIFTTFLEWLLKERTHWSLDQSMPVQYEGTYRSGRDSFISSSDRLEVGVIAIQRLFYDTSSSVGIFILIVFSPLSESFRFLRKY
jgi:hypothetical protein